MSLSLNGVSIRQDASGLYSLGDLFRASGGTHGKQPSFWLENRQPNSIAEKLKSNTGIPVLVSKHGGRNPGTYACYELVIMYSAWLNDDFHIDVLQAFKALMRGDSTTAQGIADRAFLRDEYKELTESVVVGRASLGKETQTHHFTNEADMLNNLVLGMSSKRYKFANGLGKDVDIRDYLTVDQKARLLFLQRMDSALVRTIPDYLERKVKLKELLAHQFNQVAA